MAIHEKDLSTVSLASFHIYRNRIGADEIRKIMEYTPKTLLVLVLGIVLASSVISCKPHNSAPVANAGQDQNVLTGSIVTLNGSASSDADGNPLTYNWSFASTPTGSTAALSNSTVVNPTFTPVVSGLYTVNLVVNDGKVNSVVDTVTVTATMANSAPVAKAGYEHEYEVMDKCNNSFYVYANQDEGCNHYYPSGWMGDISSISFDSSWTSNCHAGTSCIKNTFTAKGNNWAGIYWQESENNWGTVPNAGYDLAGATKLTFRAKGGNGGEKIEFFVGGITGTHPDSLSKTSTGYITLSSSWQEYTIDLTSKNLSHVIGGFGWVTNSPNNPSGAIFFLDEIKYDKARPDDLRLLGSYETFPLIDPDRYIRNVSFVYDDVLALETFLARGNSDDLRRAGIIADAFVYAMKNDRYYTDSRLRNAYMSGDLIDHRTGKARIPGWWDPVDKKWYEDKFQVSTHTGNMAWVMIALLNYYKKVGGDQYLNAAITLGEWIKMETSDAMCDGGYTGGYEGWEPNPQKITWKSTEHNIDVYVAFMLLYEITGDTKWKDRAIHAKNFVDVMWDNTGKHFWTGTGNDGCAINKTNIPIDIQAWALMAFGNYNSALTWAENNCYTEADGFKGFDFNNDRDGIWFEGTSQMAVAYQINKEISKSDFYISELIKAQVSANNANGKGIVAASHDGVTTGFDWKYFSRLHIGATAWYIFAEVGYNPYWATRTTTP